MDLMEMTVEALELELEKLSKPSDEEVKADLMQKIEEVKVFKSLKRIGQLSGREGMDALAVIALEIDKLINDEEIFEALTMEETENEPRSILGARRATKIVLLLSTKHRNSILTILSTLTGKQTDELLDSSLHLIMKLVQKVLNEDRDFVSFFTPSKR